MTFSVLPTRRYLYFLSVLDERLAWSRARLVEEGQQHAEKLMEMMIAASMAGVPEMSADLTDLPVVKKEDGPPILYSLLSLSSLVLIIYQTR